MVEGRATEGAKEGPILREVGSAELFLQLTTHTHVKKHLGSVAVGEGRGPPSSHAHSDPHKHTEFTISSTYIIDYFLGYISLQTANCGWVVESGLPNW